MEDLKEINDLKKHLVHVQPYGASFPTKIGLRRGHGANGPSAPKFARAPTNMKGTLVTNYVL